MNTEEIICSLAKKKKKLWSSAGPEEDSEEESDLSITELKALSQEKAKKRLEEKLAKDQKIKVGSQIIVSFCYF